MRPATLLITVVLTGGTACGSSEPRAKAPSESGAAAAQPADTKTARPLTHEECEQLGQTITETCRNNNTRSAVMEGWCSDVSTGVGTGSWVSDCEKHIRYVDAVCFANNDSVKGMMDCDSAVSR
jgi:hypothetical protein